MTEEEKMSSQNAVRWGGLAAIVSGALIAISVLLHPSESDPNAFVNPLWGPVHIAVGMSALLGLFGTMAIYAKLATKGGGLVLPGFVLALSGTAVFVGAAILLEGFVAPALAASAAGKTLLDPNGPLMSGPMGLVFLSSGAAFGLGFILLAVANWSANVLPRWGGVLAAIGAPLLAFAPPLPQIALMIGGVLFGVGVAWLGYAIWSSK